jgi:hypothetical protein
MYSSLIPSLVLNALADPPWLRTVAADCPVIGAAEANARVRLGNADHRGPVEAIGAFAPRCSHDLDFAVGTFRLARPGGLRPQKTRGSRSGPDKDSFVAMLKFLRYFQQYRKG